MLQHFYGLTDGRKENISMEGEDENLFMIFLFFYLFVYMCTQHGSDFYIHPSKYRWEHHRCRIPVLYHLLQRQVDNRRSGENMSSRCCEENWNGNCMSDEFHVNFTAFSSNLQVSSPIYPFENWQKLNFNEKLLNWNLRCWDVVLFTLIVYPLYPFRNYSHSVLIVIALGSLIVWNCNLFLV